mmetsp:Transcript_24136/g.60255  ORF Transcript_24136/g.60255 Transcript_24136/m.60255 type:complete len:405 (+) Transcript_24136:58-1272(+)
MPLVEGMTAEGCAAARAPPARRGLLLAVLVLGSAVFQIITELCQKKMYNAFGQRYVFFTGQLELLSYDLCVTAVVVGRAVLSASFRASLRESARRFPPSRLVIPALLDGLASFLQSVGGPSTPGTWTVLLGQSAVFFTMAFSALLLAARFTRWQVIGATLTILGACTAVLPKVVANAPAVRHAGYVLIFLSADIPHSLSLVYKDFAFKRGDLDVFYLTACVSWVQFPLSWIFLPLLSLKAFGGFDLTSLPEGISDGAACFLGDTSIPVYDAEGSITGYCSSFTTAITCATCLAGFIAAIFHLNIMKFGSATLYVLSVALSVPITNFCFEVPFVTQMLNLGVEQFSWWNTAGVVIVVIGFLLYMLIESQSHEIDASKPIAEDDVASGKTSEWASTASTSSVCDDM